MQGHPMLRRVAALLLLLLVGGVVVWAPRWPAAQSPTVQTPSPRDRAQSPERRGLSVLSALYVGRSTLPVIDEWRSLVVTDKAILDHFSFGEIMTTLTAQASDPGLSPLQLFRTWWASQDLMACPDRRFGFPYDCRPGAVEIAQADDPFNGLPPESGYIPIGLFNRIDLAPADGSDCGEYRIAFARKAARKDRNPGGRLLINFEAVLPNPTPHLGLAGCRPIAEFWYGLSAIEDPAQRARLLRRFYLEGLAGFPPAVHREHYGAHVCGTPRCATGQIRTNERLRLPWMLREFRLLPTWASSPRQFRIVPVTIKDSPFGGLVCCESGNATPEMLAAFRLDVERSVHALARPDLMDRPGLHDFRHDLDPRFDTGQGIALPRGESDLLYNFRMPPPDPSVRDALLMVIKEKLKQIGSNVSAEILMARLQALSCAGCHHLNSGVTAVDLHLAKPWPESLGFEHVSELNPESGRDGMRYRVSKAVIAFIPRRKEALRHVLAQ